MTGVVPHLPLEMTDFLLGLLMIIVHLLRYRLLCPLTDLCDQAMNVVLQLHLVTAFHLQLRTRIGACLYRLLRTGHDRWRIAGQLCWRNVVLALLALLLPTLYLLAHLSMIVLRVLFNLMIGVLVRLSRWNRELVVHLHFKKDSVSPSLLGQMIALHLDWRNG